LNFFHFVLSLDFHSTLPLQYSHPYPRFLVDISGWWSSFPGFDWATELSVSVVKDVLDYDVWSLYPCYIHLFFQAWLSTKFHWAQTASVGISSSFTLKGSTNLFTGKINDWISPHSEWIRVGRHGCLELTCSTWC
jgi:hypothetical protein